MALSWMRLAFCRRFSAADSCGARLNQFDSAIQTVRVQVFEEHFAADGPFICVAVEHHGSTPKPSETDASPPKR